MSSASDLDEMCTRAVLRVLRTPSAGAFGGAPGRLGRVDVEPLKLWWALSGQVQDLARRVHSRPREVAGVLADEERIVSGEVSGILRAVETARIQILTGDPSVFVVDEPTPTYLSGPNRVLAATLREADRVSAEYVTFARRTAFETTLTDGRRNIDRALRLSALREIALAPSGARLTPFERRQASKARAPLYRMAWAAAETLRGVEALDEAVVGRLFADGVLSELETWRRFEVACALEIALALHRRLGKPATLAPVFSADHPIAVVGEYEVWWQFSVLQRPFETLDPGEALVHDVLGGFSVSEASGRADIAVARDDEVRAFVECKWFEGAGRGRDAALEGVPQVVRYARDYNHHHGLGAPDALIGRSLLAVANRDPLPLVTSGGRLGCVDLADIEGGALDEWVEGLW